MLRIEKKLQFIILLILLIPNFVFGQLRLDTLHWQAPLNIPMFLSGNFAELRNDHFHAGIDIKTQGKEGFKVYAAKNGYVSRIKISPYGYGKALYITHPDGYTSVYAHLKEFNIQIEHYVKKIQYQKKSFAVDIYPNANQINVEQGDIIALSGNTGSSGGPHLHFEIRKTANANPLNGLFLNYKIKDTIPPKMFYLYLYQQKKSSKDDAKIFNLTEKGKNYKVSYADTLNVHRKVALGLKVDDFLNQSANRCGVYQLNLWVNNDLYFQQEYDEFSFAETRYINSVMDYKENIYKKRKLYKLYKAPNNLVSVIKRATNQGIITGNPGEVKSIKIEAVDAYNNRSELVFYLCFRKKDIPYFLERKNNFTIPWESAFEIDTAGVKVNFAAKTFYDTAFIHFEEKKQNKETFFSSAYTIGNEGIALHKYFDLEIPCYKVDSNLENKLILAKWNDRTKQYHAVGGLFVGGLLKSKVRELGTYTVMIDTVPPIIEALGKLKTNTISIRDLKIFRFFIDDDFSGIHSYKGTINGNWVLFEWDPKTKIIRYNADEYLPEKGKILLELEVIDKRENKTIFRKEYTIIP